jgi:hypothetical protein
MKMGEALEGRLIYPIYVENRLAIPAGSMLRGTVVHLDSDRSRRIHARIRGDFTPFHTPVVRFDQLILPDGTLIPLLSGNATDGAPILHLSAAVSKTKRHFVSQQIAQAKQRLKSQAALFTQPGRGDRLLQFLYAQLPYHPERIATGTAWTVELSQPLRVNLKTSSEDEADERSGSATNPAIQTASKHSPNSDAAAPAPVKPPVQAAWRLRAYLQQTISSANEKPGDTFQAVVAEPVFNANHTLAVPEGAVLIGRIAQAKPARSFGRKGKLRFDFRELKFPSGASEHVEGTLGGADANAAAGLHIDSEGGVQPKQQNGVIAPLALTVLASRAFDNDGSMAGNSAVASNGFGIVGRVAGIVASSRDFAAGIGFYGVALSVYGRWIARGQNVSFVKNTRIEVTTIPRRNPLPIAAPGNPSEGH